MTEQIELKKTYRTKGGDHVRIAERDESGEYVGHVVKRVTGHDGLKSFLRYNSHGNWLGYLGGIHDLVEEIK